MFYWRKINILLIIILFIALIPSVFPLILPGFIVTDDASWMVIRLSAFFDSLRDGQIPVRVVERLNNGYGYPVSNFLYPGFLYLGSFIHIIGFNFIDSVKVILIVSMISSGFFTYFWLKKIFDPIASFIGSLFYVYTPYHIYDLYRRGSVGEILALAFLPFILWQIERKSLVLSSFGIFMLIISHNSLAFLTLPVLILYAFLQKKGIFIIFSTVLGMLMSSFFIIPALYELSYTKFNSVQISDPRNYFATIQLIGYSSFLILPALILVVFLLRNSFKFISHKGLIFMFLAFFIGSTTLSSPVSSFFWNAVPSQIIQFPFRILSILLISVAFLSAFIVSKSSGKLRVLSPIMLIAALAFSSSFYLTNVERSTQPDEFYSTNMDTTTVQDEYMPKWVIEKPDKIFNNKFEIISGEAEIVNFSNNSRKGEIELSNALNSKVRFNQLFYPGWKAYMSNERITIDYANKFGAIEVTSPRNVGTITFIFEETPLRYIANILSVIGLIALLFIVLRPILKFK